MTPALSARQRSRAPVRQCIEADGTGTWWFPESLWLTSEKCCRRPFWIPQSCVSKHRAFCACPQQTTWAKKCSQHLHRSTSFPGNDSAKRQSSHFFCELLILRQDENEENPPAVRSSIWVVTRIPYSRVILWLIMILLVLYIIDSGSIVTINDYNLPIWIFPWITMISGIFCHRLRIWQSNINQGSVKELQCLEKQKICSCL